MGSSVPLLGALVEGVPVPEGGACSKSEWVMEAEPQLSGTEWERGSGVSRVAPAGRRPRARTGLGEALLLTS